MSNNELYLEYIPQFCSDLYGCFQKTGLSFIVPEFSFRIWKRGIIHDNNNTFEQYML